MPILIASCSVDIPGRPALFLKGNRGAMVLGERCGGRAGRGGGGRLSAGSIVCEKNKGKKEKKPRKLEKYYWSNRLITSFVRKVFSESL